MKKFRIWLNGFNLLQQFIAISLLTIAFFAIFISGFLSSTIDSFVNAQMYPYIHQSQSEFMQSYNSGHIYHNDNVSHYLFLNQSGSLMNQGDNEHPFDYDISYEKSDEDIDNYIEVDGSILPYSKTNMQFGKYTLISIMNQNYRDSFKKTLIDTVVDIIIATTVGLFLLFVIWIYSLIRPLNIIKTYIEKIKLGENATLNSKRHDEIGEVAEALTSMHTELEKQARIKEEMIQNISHDLKTPIATIKSYSESIKDGIYPYGTLENSVDVIYEHADRLERKVYSLLTLNKMGYLQDTEPGDNVNMEEVINKAILSCELLRKDIELKTNIEKSAYFHGEEESWRVVVENLIDNALRYAKTEVVVTLNENRLEVFDDGNLMDKDRIDKLFKPYEKGTNGKFGLGLSIVKRVTETYGYNVAGENMNDGVVFKIWRNPTKKRLLSIKKED